MRSLARPRRRRRFIWAPACGATGAAHCRQRGIGRGVPNATASTQSKHPSTRGAAIRHPAHAWRLRQCNCQMALSIKSRTRYGFANKSAMRRGRPGQMYGKRFPLWLQIAAFVRTESVHLGLFRYVNRNLDRNDRFHSISILSVASVKVKEQFEASLVEEVVETVRGGASSNSNSPPTSSSSPEEPPACSQVSPAARHELTAIWRCYIHLMDEINNVSQSLGKDGKFQLFICLSLRWFSDTLTT